MTGGASQVTEQRAGHLAGGAFFESLGGSLIQSRGTHPDAVELVDDEDNVRTFRISTNTLGLGYVEAISNSTLTAIRDSQPANMRGSTVIVPVLEANGKGRLGRFGWKSQHASLESFAADAYLNEMGVTSPLMPHENTVSGGDRRRTTRFDPEDDGEDVRAFANFIRATKAPARGASPPMCRPATSCSRRRMRNVPRDLDHDRPRGNIGERRRARRAGRGRQQGDPSV